MAWNTDRLVRRKKSVWELLFLACIIAIIILGIRGGPKRLPEAIPIAEPIQVPDRVQGDGKSALVDAPKALWCRSLTNAEDFVVSVKTSAAEIADKLPPLLESNLRCPHHLLVFSDWQETIKGQPVIDALEHVDAKFQATHPDFDLWRRLRGGGPDVLEDEEMWESDKTSQSLDKWKLLPMLNRTYHEYPTKKWFIFTTTSTYLFHSNLLTWLSQYNATLPHYIGIQSLTTTIDPLLHGETFILSTPALHTLVSEYNSYPSAYHDLVASHTHGGTILRHIVHKVSAKAFNDYESRIKHGLSPKNVLNAVNIPAWPILQPQSPATLDYRAIRDFKRLWCFPTVSHENLSPPEIVEMHKFEASWIAEHPRKDITHADVLKDYILPRLIVRGGRADDWENFSAKEFMGERQVEGVSECLAVCEGNESCVQYEFFEGKCRFGDAPRMGRFKGGSQSRWLLAKVQKWAEGMGVCKDQEGWFTV